MRQWGENVTFGASSRSYAAEKWMFEHRGAVPAPLGGGEIAHSLIRPAHMAPRHDIRYYRCAFLNRLVSLIRERIWRSTRVGAVCWPVFEHREAVLTPLRGGTITHSLARPTQLAP
jgi:hypothetical protein